MSGLAEGKGDGIREVEMGLPMVLILCTGNSARSQMAEGLLRTRAGDRFEVASAGTEPAARVHPMAIEVMREVGIDLGGAQPKDIARFLGQAPVRHLIIVCHDAEGRCPSVWPGAISRVHWPIEDPAAFRGDPDSTRAKFREVREELSRRLDQWLAEHSTTTAVRG
ncbi:MAG TPA: arsenate reductase ArsC [Candidatus Sulfotelmatobacter sp.]|nr:arsenate reductase ArsC [Candidatus Sulfotelmatobacter sp.]